MAGVLNIALLGLLATYGADAISNFRGSEQTQVQTMIASHQAPQVEVPAFAWGQFGMSIIIGLVVVACIGGVAAFALKGRGGGEEAKEVEGEEGEATGAASEPKEASMSKDYQKLLKVLAQKVAQEAGPKLSKAGAVKNVLDSRMASFQDKAKSFLLNEMNSTAGAVLSELDAPEAMMLLDWDHAVEANFPPASILVAGVLSPTMLNLMSFHHLIQMIAVGLPIMILCVCAIYIDWSAPCAIPSIFPWLFTQTALAFFLVIGHGCLFLKVVSGKKQLAAKAEEVHAKHNNEDSALALRDEFVDNTIILQEALLVENGVRHSFWNQIVGVCTFAWVITTLWNLFLICRYTFVPGIIAFHPKAHHSDDFCGAWMTVLVLRINILLAVLFFFFNLATVVQWVCDMMIENQGFQQNVISEAKKIDSNGSGLPVVELLVKAFLLRGGADTLDARLAVVNSKKAILEREQAQVTAALASLTSEIDSASSQEASLKQTCEDVGGDIALQVKSLGSTGDLALWKAQGKEVLEREAKKMQEETTKAVEELLEAIKKAIDDARNSETAKALQVKYQQTQQMIKENAEKAMNTLNDPEFQKNLMEAAKKNLEDAQALANDAIAAAKDPAKQEELQKAMHDAMEKAQKMAQEVAEAANDPEKRKQLQEQAQKAMEVAQQKAQEAAENLQSEEMQAKIREAAQKAMDQAQLAADSAIAAAQNPEKAMEDAKQAMQEAKKQLEAAANDPALKEAAAKAKAAAEKKMKEAQAAAEEVKEIANKAAASL